MNVALCPELLTGNYISLFAGGAGLDLAVRIVNPASRCVCYVERELAAATLLATRAQEGALDDAPVWSDVCTFDGHPWRGLVDGIIGGFPCQDLSVAGKRAGIQRGNRSGLFFEYARIIREVQPRWVAIENVRAVLAFPAAGIVLGELASMGFDAVWGSLQASDVGASHERHRKFILAYRYNSRQQAGSAILRGTVDDADRQRRGARRTWDHGSNERYIADANGGWMVPGSIFDRRPAEKRLAGGHTLNLQDQVHLWQSPRATDGEKGGSNQRGSKGDMMLPGQALHWGTPSSRDWKDTEGMSTTGTNPDGSERTRLDQLPRQAMQWRTPAERDHHPSSRENRTNHVAQIQLAHQAEVWPAELEEQWDSGRSVQPTRDGRMCWCGIHGCGQRSHRRKLNPVFVEWLMGWPLFWTDVSTVFDSAAMALFLSRARRLLQNCEGGLSDE